MWPCSVSYHLAILCISFTPPTRCSQELEILKGKATSQGHRLPLIFALRVYNSPGAQTPCFLDVELVCV
jgi:hypothetical protein